MIYFAGGGITCANMKGVSRMRTMVVVIWYCQRSECGAKEG